MKGSDFFVEHEKLGAWYYRTTSTGINIPLTKVEAEKLARKLAVANRLPVAEFRVKEAK